MERGLESLRVRVVSNGRLASRIVSSVMGEYHGYYAGWAARTCGEGLVAMVNDEPAGAAVYYRVEGNGRSIGVIYYVAVLRDYRRMGLGRILVASAEEALGDVDVYVATTSESNVASRRLFSSMGYRVESWEAFEARTSPATAEALYLAACAYEDDIVMYKEAWRGALKGLGAAMLRAAQEAWDELCLKPYVLRRASRRARWPLKIPPVLSV
jgi:GNAT superfamily N-acetyltransferase